jgi:protein-disulfide isomerase
MHENVKVLLEKYKYQVRLIHKNYPLDSSCNPSVPAPMHPNACNAAAASVCAQSMGKYQSYSEKLWTATDLTPQSLIAMAAGEGMDKTAFQQCMKSDETRLKVLNDISVGDAIKLEATPTFVINGLKFTGYKEVKWCSTLIDKLLKGEPIPPSGVPLQDE